ncbi:hypothetical protein QFZ66_000580 [Streptomyces sp. B4I13]|nr:hypothetical protein [Streptomyces sp. B4I13]
MGLLTRPGTATATAAAALVLAVTCVPASAAARPAPSTSSASALSAASSALSAASPSSAAQPSGSRASSPDCGTHTSVRRALGTLTEDDRLAEAAVAVTDPVCGRWSAATGTADLGTGRPMNARGAWKSCVLGPAVRPVRPRRHRQGTAEGGGDHPVWDRPRERPTVVRDDLPALMVNATGDPRTTYAGATAMHRAWPSSRLVTVTGSDRHGLYGAYGDDCADRTVNAYLSTGRLPAADVTCPAPRPSGASGTRADAPARPEGGRR